MEECQEVISEKMAQVSDTVYEGVEEVFPTHCAGDTMKRFYFTNPTYDRHKGQYVRLAIEGELKGIVELVSPFYDRNGTPTPEIAALDKGEVPEIEDDVIVEGDLRKVQECDGLVAWITRRSSWGSIQEACITFREYHKPVYIIFDPFSRGTCQHCKGFNPNHPTHPWARKHATKIFPNIQAFIQFAKERL